MDDSEILAASLTLSDCQHAVAINYGFGTWSKLRAHVQKASANLAALIATIDPSGIEEQVQLSRERGDCVIRCTSGKMHHVRFGIPREPLRNEIWGYHAFRDAGVPCREIEKVVDPCDEFPDGCLVASWIEGITAAQFLEREGETDASRQLCVTLGQALWHMHSAEATGEIPSWVGRSDRDNFIKYGTGQAKGLRRDGLVDAAFERRYIGVVERYAERVPEPCPRTLYFGDMHFSNIIISDSSAPEVIAFIDLAETGVGWPLFDFTNWERWELSYSHAWVRTPVLEAYGDIDVEMYRMAMLIRYTEYHDLFSGEIGNQIKRVVDTGDPMALNLDKLNIK